MKALVVTSQITFVPNNYGDFLASLLASARPHIAGVLLLSNLDIEFAKTTLGLFGLGARRMSATMMKNMASLPFDERAKLVKSYNIPLLRAESVNSKEIIEWVTSHEIDIIINARTRCIFKNEILKSPRLGCINIHHGLLPEWRGTMCDLFAMSQRKITGFTIHVMTKKVDDGAILVRQEVSTPGDLNYLHHIQRSAGIEGEQMATLLNTIAKDGRIPEGTPNVCDNAMYMKTPKSRDDIKKILATGIIL